MERCLTIIVNRVNMSVHLTYQKLDNVLIAANASIMKRRIGIFIGFVLIIS